MTSREWGAYPIIKFPDLPKIDVLMLPRQDQPPLGVGESASVPSAAAIANAIFDATGVRFREPPFTPERILAGLRGETALLPRRIAGTGAQAAGLSRQLAKSVRRTPRRVREHRRALRRGDRHRRGHAAVAIDRADRAAGCFGLFGGDHRARPAARGARRLRGLPHRCNGVVNAGGRAIETPFGTIYSTNITPDVETGIGAWSYPAFERAMREGIHRDGRQLYPAFPYTHFAKATDADLQALYAYLMAQAPVRADNRDNQPRVSVQLAPAAGRLECAVPPPESFKPDATNPRSGIAAPIWSKASAIAAPAIRRAMRSARRRPTPISPAACGGLGSPAADVAVACADPWSEDELFAYLRSGESQFHGVAAGPLRRPG